MVELLSPVGDFECLKAAVQGGANSVYFGGQLFNARNSAKNFDSEGLKAAIRYAKLRNVKINFTLNTLVKNDEFQEAINLAEEVYELGCDAIIVQDLGLAKYIIKNMPGMDVHGSTQMSIHNLQGALELQNLGFKRVVLSRELNIEEIENICKKSNIEIEVFAHGALCISYSGQCLFSSIVGGRSGNRGRCAQSCRLPYRLIKSEKGSSNDKTNTEIIDKGYLLSTHDLCGLEYIPRLIKAGVKCFKIEGRMKPPEYVYTVTSIYRKYIDLALSDKPYKIEEADIKRLMQVFNRGGFSNGNFDINPNTNYIYKEKPSNIGLFIGNISNINKDRGLITFTTKEELQIGDNFAVQREDHTYTVSELMKNRVNIKTAKPGDKITIGRVKGELKTGDKVYKLSNSEITKNVQQYISEEHVKIPLSGKIIIKKGKNISFEVETEETNKESIYYGIKVTKEIGLQPDTAIKSPVTEKRVVEQLTKTNNTQFEFKKIDVLMDNDLFIPKISAINELRRDALKEVEKLAISRFEREKKNEKPETDFKEKNIIKNREISVLLNVIDEKIDYSKMEKVDRIYIPVKFIGKENLEKQIKQLRKKGDLYIEIPTILKDNFRSVFFNNIQNMIEKYGIKGLVVKNIGELNYLKDFNNIDIIGGFNLNIFNDYTIDELEKLGVSRVQLSPELDQETINDLSNKSSIQTEFMVYGRLPIMNIGYCPLGKSNRCYPGCKCLCREKDKEFYLEDRMGFKFKIQPDNVQTITTIYNSKITSVSYDKVNVDGLMISLLDEDISKINEVIEKVKNDEEFSGKDYTFGNLTRFV